MEISKPSLVITEWKGDTPISAICRMGHAVFPTLKGKEPEANKRLLEISFRNT